MGIQITEILWFTGATVMLAATLLNNRGANHVRVPLLQPAAQTIVALALLLLGRDAAAAGRAPGAWLSYAAAIEIGSAAAIMVTRWFRGRA